MNLIKRKRMILVYINITLIMTIFQSTGYCQVQNANLPLNERLDYVLERVSMIYHIKGVSASVNMGDNNVWKGVYGNINDTQKIDTSTFYGIASLTKTFASTIILQLVVEGVLSLDDPITKWLPEYKNVSPLITIHQLLNHTSGIDDYIVKLWDAAKAVPNKEWSQEEIIGSIGKPFFNPGKSYSYSNSGYYFLGMIIEKATGHTFSQELKARITGPLRLKSTWLVTHDSLVSKIPDVWEYSSAQHKNISALYNTKSFFSLAWTAGGMVSTTKELSDFFMYLFHKKTLLTDTMLYKMVHNGLGSYAYGIESKYFNRYDKKNTITFGNTGSIAATATGCYVPEDSVSLGIICNQNNYDYINNIMPELYTAIINQAPTDIFLSTDSIPEDLGINTSIGKFSTEDRNNHSSYKYSLIKGDGVNDKDNNCFTIVNRNLQSNCGFNYTIQNEYHIFVKSEDGYGGTISKPFVLKIKTNALGIENSPVISGIVIYPNPSKSVIHLTNWCFKGSIPKYSIIDFEGRTIQAGIIEDNSIYISTKKSGIYTLQIVNLEKILTKKIIIK